VLPGRPYPLESGDRFQVGHYAVELRLPASMLAAAVAPTAPDGEVFRSRALSPIAYLDFIGPDGHVSASFPITQDGPTVIGREVEDCDIWLTGDYWASRQHAQVVLRDGRIDLEDLGSANGTFVLVRERRPLATEGDILLFGEVLFRVVES